MTDHIHVVLATFPYGPDRHLRQSCLCGAVRDKIGAQYGAWSE